MLVTVPISIPVLAIGKMMRFTIGFPAPGSLVCANTEPGQWQQSEVEDCGMNVSPVSKAPDQWQRVHGPIEAERVWAQEQPEVDGRQVEEG